MADDIPKKIGKGSRRKVLDYLLAHMGEVLWWEQIREASGGKEQWSRRLRELRDEFGYQILSHRDRDFLKPGQYLIETTDRLDVAPRNISKETRAYVLDRNGYTCYSCGAAAGDQDPMHSSRKVNLTMGHIIDKSKGGSDDADNLRAICSNCNEGLQNIAAPRPKLKDLLIRVRRASVADQRQVFEWLKKKLHKD